MSGRFKALACPSCGRQFRTTEAWSQHVAAKHRTKPPVEPRVRPRRDDGEETMAERAIEATIARASGMPSEDDWLLP